MICGHCGQVTPDYQFWNSFMNKMITIYRFYHVSPALYSVKKLGVKLNKMIHPKAKRQWYPTQLETNIMPSVKSLTKIQNEPGKRAMRRSAMLNKMFMKNITDIMSTGTVAIDVVGRGIEISKVKITSDLQKVLVFWVCKGNASDTETESVLNNIAGALRHELSVLRVMGEVPYIEFVKDHQEALIADLDRRLQLADYGEDYTPTDMGHLLKTEFTLNTKLSPEMKAKIRQLEEEIPVMEDPLPEMTHNVFGLEHSKILNRLLAARKKSRDAWSRVDETAESVISYRTVENRKSDVDIGSQKNELADFLMKRKIQQDKIYKEMRKSESWQLQPTVDDDSEHDDEYSYDDDHFEENEDYFYEHDFNVNKDKKS